MSVDLKYELTIEMAEALAGLRDLTSAINNLENSVKKTSSQIDNLSSSTDNLSDENKDLENSVEKVNTDLNKEETLLSKVKRKVDELTGSNSKLAKAVSFSSTTIGKMGTALAGFIAFDTIKDFGKESIEKFKQAESAYKNFEMTVKGTGNSVASAMSVIKETTASGLVTTEEAMETLNNYLKMGFTMNEARGQMKRDLDLGAARKQSHYGTVGEAMKVASQGNLQENSTLSDALGNDKNISKIFEDYAKGVGKTTDELTKQDKVLARIKASEEMYLETKGAAAKMSQTVAGKEAQLSAQYTRTQEMVGQALVPAYKMLIDAASLVLNGVDGLVIGLKSLGLTAADFFSKIGALWDYAFDWDKKKLDDKFKSFKEAYEAGLEDIVKESKGAYFNGQDDETPGKKKAEVAKTEAEIANEKRKAEELNLKKEKLALEKSKLELDIALTDKLISLEEYKKKASEILSKAYDVDVKLKGSEKSTIEFNLGNTSDLTTEAKQQMQLQLAEIDKSLSELNLKKKQDSESLNNFKGFGNSSSSQDVMEARLDLVSQTLSNELNLIRESSNQELSILQDKFSNFEVSTEEYYKRKKELVDEDFKYQENVAKAELAKARATSTSNEAERINKVIAVANAENNLKIIQMQRTGVLSDLTREQKRYQEQLDKQTENIKIDRNVNIENTRVQLAQVEADLLLATEAINQEERLKLEADFQNKLLSIQKNALEERRKLTKNPAEISQINAEIEAIELQHSVKLKQISNDIYKEQRKTYDEIIGATKSSVDSLFNDISSLKSVLSNLAKQIAIIFAKKALGYDEMFKDGGSLSNLVKKLLGTPEKAPELATTATNAGAGLLGSVLPGVAPGGAIGGTGAMSVQAGVVNLSSTGTGIGGDLLNTDNLTTGLSEKLSSVFDSLGSTLSGLFNSLTSSLSSVFSGLAGSGGSGIVSGIGSFLSSIPWFDVGADNLSRDQIAMVHKGERILTAKENKTASPLLDNPEQFIRNAVGGGGSQNITNNYNFSNPVDRRTSDQLAAKSAEAMMRAQRNR